MLGFAVTEAVGYWLLWLHFLFYLVNMVGNIINIYYHIKIMLAKYPRVKLLVQFLVFFFLGYILHVYIIPSRVGFRMLISSYHRLGKRIISKTSNSLIALSQTRDPFIFALILADYFMFILLVIAVTIIITMKCCSGFK